MSDGICQDFERRYPGLKWKSFSTLSEANSVLDDLKDVLDQGADPNWYQDDHPALICAINAGRLDFVEELLSRNVNLFVLSEEIDESPLMAAIRCRRADIVQKLIDHNPSVISFRNEHSETPLMVAARYGRLESLKTILSAGAKLDEQDKFEATALHFAAASGRLSCIEYLLDMGAALEAKDRSWKTPLASAVLCLTATTRHQNALQVIETLIRRGADVNVRDRHGRDLTMLTEDKEVISLIVQARMLKAVSPSASEDDGYVYAIGL